MNSELSRQEKVVLRLETWSLPAVYLVTFVVTWLLHGKFELVSVWLNIWKYVLIGLLVLQLVGAAFLLRRLVLVPAILLFIVGLSLLGFMIFAKVWLLFLGGATLVAAGAKLAWPQILNLFQFLSHSFDEISKSTKG